jgi:hypothetical protein
LKHKWTDDDDIVTLYLYKFDVKGLPFSLNTIACKLGIIVGSLKMRISNFSYIDKKVGLANFAKRTEKIYNKFNGLSETELRSLVLKILNVCNSKSRVKTSEGKN